MSKYFRSLLIGIDQFFNTLTGGQADETLSSRMGRLKEVNKIAKIGCWTLDLIDKDHCINSIEYDINGNPTPHHLNKILDAKKEHKEEAKEIKVAMMFKDLETENA